MVKLEALSKKADKEAKNIITDFERVSFLLGWNKEVRHCFKLLKEYLERKTEASKRKVQLEIKRLAREHVHSKYSQEERYRVFRKNLQSQASS